MCFSSRCLGCLLLWTFFLCQTMAAAIFFSDLHYACFLIVLLRRLIRTVAQRWYVPGLSWQLPGQVECSIGGQWGQNCGGIWWIHREGLPDNFKEILVHHQASEEAEAMQHYNTLLTSTLDIVSWWRECKALPSTHLPLEKQSLDSLR